MLSIQKTQVQLEKERMENPPEKMEVLQEELELEKEKKEIISSLYNDWIYEYNVQERKLTTISGSGAHYSSLKGDESEQKYLMLDDLHPEDRAAFVECCKGKYNGSEPSYMEARIMVDDEYRWISLTTRVLKNRAGDVVSVIGKISDINVQKKEELRLQAQAMQDSMTGLLNRTAFLEQSEKLLELAVGTEGKSPAMIIVDIDNFKQINDHYGHLYGDTVIVSMADALRTVFCDDAAIGRFGGDEFTVFLPHADKNRLEDKILQLREAYFREIAEAEDGQKVTFVCDHMGEKSCGSRIFLGLGDVHMLADKADEIAVFDVNAIQLRIADGGRDHARLGVLHGLCGLLQNGIDVLLVEVHRGHGNVSGTQVLALQDVNGCLGVDLSSLTGC